MTADAAAWRTMEDSVSPAAITGTPDLVAGYPDLSWTEGDFERFAQRGIGTVRVTQRSPADWEKCSVGDAEPGALTWEELRQFLIDRDRYRPGTQTAYASVSNLPAVGEACDGLSYWVWAAEWPNYPTPAEVGQIRSMLRPGAKLAAIQWFNDVPGDIDRSVVIDPGWHPAPRHRASLTLPEKAMAIPFVADIKTWVEKSEAEVRDLLASHGPELEKLARIAEAVDSNPLLKSALAFVGISPAAEQAFADMLDRVGAEITSLVQQATENGKAAGAASARQPEAAPEPEVPAEEPLPEGEPLPPENPLA